MLRSLLFNEEGDGSGPQPSRAHWVPDSKAQFCSTIGCGRMFTMIDRRHHCRR